MLSHSNHVQICDTVDYSPPGSFCPWDYPGRNTGVDYHFLPQRDSMWGFVYSNFSRIRTPKLNDFKGKLERRQCGNRNRVSGRMCVLALKMKDSMAKKFVGH